jgi:hypothetical protein
MALAYADALAALYRSSQELFVGERKRLAAELKAGGDKEGAARFGKLARPTLSAWAVNQLWWQARPLFEELLSSSERLRHGDRSAGSTHRDALTALRTRAAALLAEGGHAATDATLRRVTTTLSALAAAGGFEPEAPGALSADRDPPGFEAMGDFGGFASGGTGLAAAAPVAELATTAAARAGATAAPEPVAEAAAAGAAVKTAAGATAAQQEAQRQAAARQEREERARKEKEREQREQRERERQQTKGALSRARTQLAEHVASVERLEADLARARQAVERAQSAVAELEQRLAGLVDGES